MLYILVGIGQRPQLAQPPTEWQPHLLAQFATYQRKLIDAAITLLKPGGILTYSTCTINPDENEGNVAYILKEYDQMQLISCPEHACVGSSGLVSYGLSQEQAAKLQRFGPDEDQSVDSICFFLARFVKLSTIDQVDATKL